MTVVMDIFRSFEVKLKELDYPNINTLSQDQIADIFSSVNREHFLIWYIEKLYQNKIPSSIKNFSSYAADVIHKNGFCTSSEKNSFAEGSKLDILIQLKIIRVMLDHLLLIQSNKENLVSSYIKTDISDIDMFLKQDINLFPVYGPMKVRTSSERKQKINECEQEIQFVEQQIESLRQENNLNVECGTSEKAFDEDRIKCLQNNIQNFTEDSINLLTYKVVHEKDNCEFKEGFADITLNCKAQMSCVAKCVECMKVTSNFSLVSSVRNREENELIDDIRHLTKLSNELIKWDKNEA